MRPQVQLALGDEEVVGPVGPHRDLGGLPDQRQCLVVLSHVPVDRGEDVQQLRLRGGFPDQLGLGPLGPQLQHVERGDRPAPGPMRIRDLEQPHDEVADDPRPRGLAPADPRLPQGGAEPPHQRERTAPPAITATRCRCTNLSVR